MSVYWIPNLLVLLGAPRTQQNRDLLMSWWAWEGGNGGPRGDVKPSAKYNWLNTTTKVLGSKNFNVLNPATGSGVQNYPTYLSGLHATNKTLRKPEYAGIVLALKTGTPLKPKPSPFLVSGLSIWVSGKPDSTIGLAYADRVIKLALAYEKV